VGWEVREERTTCEDLVKFDVCELESMVLHFEDVLIHLFP
jgi:hypothetical protein